MQFQKVNEGGAKRADGVSVQIKHPEYLEYRAGEKMVEITLDFEQATRRANVYASDVSNWTRPEGVPLTAKEKAELRQNLQEALALLTGNFVVK